MDKALAGRTVVVTRPRAPGAPLAAALAALGARVVVAPLIRTLPPRSWRGLDDALRGLADFDAVAFASVNSVEFFFARAKALRLRPARPRVAAVVGAATAKALAAHGWKAAVVPEDARAEGLVRSLNLPRGARVLLPRAEHGLEFLPERLAASGAVVTRATAYRTVPDAAGRRAPPRAGARAAPAPGPGGGGGAGAAGGGGGGRRRGGLRLGLRGRLGGGRVRGLRLPPRVPGLRRRGDRSDDGRGPARLRRASRRGRQKAGRRIAGRRGRRRPEGKDVKARLATLKKALSRAGAVLRRNFGKVTYRQKRRADLVTAADLESQRAILAEIRRAHPEDDYRAEEDAVKLTGAEYLWVIDPLDGTTNYAHSYPASCASIGVLRRGRPALGGIYDPSRGALFLAEKGRGAPLDGRRLRVTRVGRVADSLLITGFAYDRAERADYYLARFKTFLTRSHDVRRSGSAALDLAWIAAGRADGFWEYALNPWDVCAGWLLVTEAGGKVTDFSGRPWRDPETLGAQTLATNGRVHAEMLALLRKTR